MMKRQTDRQTDKKRKKVKELQITLKRKQMLPETSVNKNIYSLLFIQVHF